MKNRYVALSLAALSLAGFCWSAQGASRQILHRFTNDLSGNSDGAFPKARLISDSQGNLYGTTSEGGTYGYGTVFQLTPPIPGGTEWAQTVLYSFCQEDSCNDGSYPTAGLTIDTNGNLYGTTSEGGFSGEGMVFKLKPPENGETAWTLEGVYNFCPQFGCNDGAWPYAGLIFGPQGALYGTTSQGGEWDFGTVFKLTFSNLNSPPWTYTVLYTFDGAGVSDGAYPYAGVIAGPQGTLYGTTFEGGYSGGSGACAFDNGCGTVFKLTGLGTGQTALIGINAP
jgi:uncharacterized repeat protein (TIGR03803 family)